MTASASGLSSRFDDALTYAARVHAGQLRKGTKIPYVAHLLAVASLMLDAGGDEDQAIAALLHDAIEDQGGRLRLEEIRQRFGDRVARIVERCSDSDVVDPAQKLLLDGPGDVTVAVTNGAQGAATGRTSAHSCTRRGSAGSPRNAGRRWEVLGGTSNPRVAGSTPARRTKKSRTS